jgi:hypothetical protein
MIARGFKSVIWVATVGGAALSCYMVSLQVATERNALEKVERQIVAAKQDIRALQTELGTRGRLSQLEHWNAEVLALSAPTSAQFVPNEFTLARLDQRQPTIEEQSAEVRLAAAEAPPAKTEPTAPVVQAAAPVQAAPVLVRQASYVPGAAEKPAAAKPASAPTKAKVEDAQAKPKADLETAQAKPKAAKPAAAAPKKDEPRPARLGRLADELGAAARQEKANGGN